MEENLENVKEKLRKYGQEHLLLKYHDMDENDQEELLNEINSIDFDLMKKLYQKAIERFRFSSVY